MTSSPSDSDVATSVVIPAYNEKGNLEPLVDELHAVFQTEEGRKFEPYEILLVDDGSTDGTTLEVTSLAEDHPAVRGLILQRNFGQSAAISAGVDHASGERLVTMDGDLQNDPADVPSLLEELESGYHCVKGWRHDRRDSLGKRLPSAIQTALTWRLGPKIHDFACGIAAYRTAALRDIPIYGETHRYFPAMLQSWGYRVTEIQVNHRSRGAGATKYGPRRLGRGFVDLLFHAYWGHYGRRPLHAFGVAALAIFLVGSLLVGGFAVAGVRGLGLSLSGWTALLGFGFTILIATVLVSVGIILETITRRHFRTARPYRTEAVVEGLSRSQENDTSTAEGQQTDARRIVGLNRD